MKFKELISKLSQINSYHSKIYVFGSILKSSRYQDIDVLLIYQDYSELVSLKNVIQELFPFELIHFTCLTQNEESELEFIEATNAEQIQTAHNTGFALVGG